MLRPCLRLPLVATLLPFITSTLTHAEQPAKKTDTVQLSGAVQMPAEWSAEKIAKDFASDVKVVNYTVKGESAKARVVPLIKLVMAAKPKIDPKQKNHLLAFTVIVRAADGYAAAFSVGELIPDYGNAEVYIALDKDGQPLPDSQRPVSLLVPGDKKPSRWVHGVISIEVVVGAVQLKGP